MSATATALRCVKCCGDDVIVRWHAEGGHYGNGACGRFAQVVVYGEHLHMTCRTCQYEWVEEPRDRA